MIQTNIRLLNGSLAVMCPHAAESWPVLAKLAKAKGFGNLGVIQAYGWASASGGTHAHGTALDVNTTDPDLSLLAREAGWAASWPRGPAQGFSNHSHLVVRCPCNPNAAAYQTFAVLAGYDGLGANGRGGRDYAPRPATWRDWQAGLDWARAELGTDIKIQPPKVPQEDQMQIVTSGPAIGDWRSQTLITAAGSAALANPTEAYCVFRHKQELERVGGEVGLLLDSELETARGVFRRLYASTMGTAETARNITGEDGPPIRELAAQAISVGVPHADVADAVTMALGADAAEPILTELLADVQEHLS